jgi:hypothetical protein
MGIDPAETRPFRRAGKSVLRQQLVEARIEELKSRIATGGLREAAIRALLYAGMPRGALDERGIAVVRGIRLATDGMARTTLPQFKALVREQYFMLLLEPEAAVEAISGLLPPDTEARRKAFAAVQQVLMARGQLEPEVADRLQRVARLFGIDIGPPGLSTAPKASKPETEPAERAIAS